MIISWGCHCWLAQQCVIEKHCWSSQQWHPNDGLMMEIESTGDTAIAAKD
jgi:hypothetical protein